MQRQRTPRRGDPRFQSHILGQAELNNAPLVGVPAGLDLFLTEPAVVQLLDDLQQRPQDAGERWGALLLDLPPTRPGAEDDVFLAAHGDDGRLRFFPQQRDHLALLGFGERSPLAVHDEVAIVAHPLEFVAAEPRGQRRRRLLEAEQAGVTDDLARQQLVVVGEGVLRPVVERQADGRLPARAAHAGRLARLRGRAGGPVDERGNGVHALPPGHQCRSAV